MSDEQIEKIKEVLKRSENVAIMLLIATALLAAVFISGLRACSTAPKDKVVTVTNVTTATDTSTDTGTDTACVSCGNGFCWGDEAQVSCPVGPGDKTYVCTRSGMVLKEDDCRLSSSTGTGTGTEPGCDETTFEEHVLPVLSRDCAASCHNHDPLLQYDTAKQKIDQILERLRLPSANTFSMPRGAEMSEPERILYVEPFEAWKRAGLKDRCDEPGDDDDDRAEAQSLPTVVAAITADPVADRDATNTRYLVGDEFGPDLDTVRGAAAKALNHVSFDGATHDLRDVAKGVWRLDLRDFGLSDADWRFIEDKDPLGYECTSAACEALKIKFGTKKPWLPVSVLLDVTQRQARTYYDLTKTPATLVDYQRKMGADFAKDLRERRARFIGVHDSPLAPHNRLIVRFNSAFGGCWQTFDTGPSNDVRAALEVAPFIDGDDLGRLFAHVASELFCQLPNGGWHATLWNAQGQLQTVAPVDVVQDYRRARLGQSPLIEPPLSCWGCHSGGMLARVDEIRGPVVGRGAGAIGGQANFERFKEFYGVAAENARLFEDDNRRFLSVLQSIGIDGAKDDPINQLVDSYVARWDLAKFAAFARISTDAAKACVEGSEQGSIQAESLVRGGQITAQQFFSVWPFLRDDCDLLDDPLTGEGD